MTILAYILSYLFIGLICCIIVTYLETKYLNTKYNRSNNRYRNPNESDNSLPILALFVWPISIPVILIVVLSFKLNSAINKLRKLFDEQAE